MIYETNPLKGVVARIFKGLNGREKETFADIVTDASLGADYIVSNYGRVFCSNTNEEIMPFYFPSRKTYKVVSLQGVSKKRIPLSVNVLVARAFVPLTARDIDLKRDLVHVKDWNMNNSRYSNLVWVNHFDLFIYESMRDNDSEENLVECICKMLIKGYTSKDMTAILGVPVRRSMINAIKKNKIYPEITSRYVFEK